MLFLCCPPEESCCPFITPQLFLSTDPSSLLCLSTIEVRRLGETVEVSAMHQPSAVHFSVLLLLLLTSACSSVYHLN